MPCAAAYSLTRTEEPAGLRSEMPAHRQASRQRQRRKAALFPALRLEFLFQECKTASFPHRAAKPRHSFAANRTLAAQRRRRVLCEGGEEKNGVCCFNPARLSTHTRRKAYPHHQIGRRAKARANQFRHKYVCMLCEANVPEETAVQIAESANAKIIY